MKPYKVLFAALAAAVALTALLAVAAYALPQLLPSAAPNNKLEIVATSGAVLESTEGAKLVCAAAKGGGWLETDVLGTFRMTYEQCTAGGSSCETEGDPAEVMLAEGSFHFVYDTLGEVSTTLEGPETLGIALLALLKEVSGKCFHGLVTFNIKGTWLCLILTPLVASISHGVGCFGEGGRAKYHTYWNDSGTKIENVQMLLSENGGPFVEAAGQIGPRLITFERAAWMNE
jgi:hypothetical protein